MRRRGIGDWDLPPAPPGYALRQARPEDQPALIEVERRAAVLYEPFGLNGFFGHAVARSSRMTDALEAGHVWVAVEETTDQPVGFALAEPKDRYAYLAELDVDPEHGRRGLGSALLETVVRWARAHAAPGLWLTTQANIPWNAPFYARRGFVIMPPPKQPHFIRDILSRQAAIGFPMVYRVAMMRDPR